MKVTPIRTHKISPKQQTIFELLDQYAPKLGENRVLVVTSKIISLCEGRVVSTEDNDRDELVTKESDLYLPRRFSKWNFELTITHRTMVMSAGIDESNGGGSHYILWPKNPQRSANRIWEYLRRKYRLDNLGVVITDSTTTPLRWGTSGVAIAYCGFSPKNSYIGKPDVFGRTLKVSQSNVAGGLATAAVLCMGEGNEQTPLALITEVPFVDFQDRPPTDKELDEYFVANIEEDVFFPLLKGVDWQKGKRGTAH